MVLRELAARLGLDVDAQSFAKGAGAVEAVKVGLELLVDVAVEAVQAFKENITEALEYGDATRKASQAIGVESEALQELQYAAGLSDLSVEELNGGTAILTRNMRAAAAGGEEQAKAFAKAGVKIKDANGKLRAADEVIGDLSAKFKTLPDGAEKTALAMQVLGRSGARWIPFLNSDLAEAREEARALGLVMGEDAQQASEEINDNLTRLSLISKGLWRGALAPLLPAISDLVKQFLAWRKANAEVMRQRLQGFLSGLLKVVRALGTAFAVLVKVTSEASGLIRRQWVVLAVVATAATLAWVAANYALIGSMLLAAAKSTIAAARIAAGWALAAAPFVLIASAIAGIMLLLDDIETYHKGGDSLFGRWRVAIDEWLKAGEGKEPWWLRIVKDFVREMRNAIEAIDEFNAKNIWGAATGPGGPLPTTPTRAAGHTRPATWKEIVSGRYEPLDSGRPGFNYVPDASLPPTYTPTARPAGGGGVVVRQTNAPVLNFNGPTDKATVDYAYERLDDWYAGKMEEAAAALPAVQ